MTVARAEGRWDTLPPAGGTAWGAGLVTGSACWFGARHTQPGTLPGEGGEERV